MKINGTVFPLQHSIITVLVVLFTTCQFPLTSAKKSLQSVYLMSWFSLRFREEYIMDFPDNKNSLQNLTLTAEVVNSLVIRTDQVHRRNGSTLVTSRRKKPSADFFRNSLFQWAPSWWTQKSRVAPITCVIVAAAFPLSDRDTPPRNHLCPN